MKKIFLCFLMLAGIAGAQSTTPNLGMSWPAHLSANGTWDSNVVGNSVIIDTIFSIPDCGDATHAVGWSFSQKKLTCQAISTGGTNALTLLSGTWAAPGAIGSGTPSTGVFTLVTVTGLTASLPVCTDGSKVLTTSGCSGGGTPGGSSTQVQFNDSSAFAGNSNFTYNKTTSTASVNSLITKNSPNIDPRAFGCKGDGTDTSSAATVCWQNAVNQMYSIGGTVICPGGTSWHLDRVKLSNFTTIRGGGTTPISGCIIAPAVDAAFIPLGPGDYLGSVTITDIFFQGGSNVIDLPLINQSNFERLEFTDYTGCAMTFIDGEQRTIRDIASIHNGVNGFAVICSGDKTKSLFSSLVPAPGFEWGFASSLVERIIDIGSTIGSGGVHNQWLWYGSGIQAGGSGGPTAGGTFGVNALNLTCRWSCVAGLMQFYNTIDTTWAIIGVDNIGITASPIPIGVNVQNQSINTWWNGLDFATNTNQMTTEMFIGSMQGGGIVNSLFSTSVDNSTTFGLKFGGGGYGALIGVKGGVFGAAGAGQRDEFNVMGSWLTPSNISNGIIGNFTNSNIDVNLMADPFLTNASTALFRVRAAPGGTAALTPVFTVGLQSASILNGAVAYQGGIFYTGNKTTPLIGGGGGVTSVQSNAFNSTNAAGNTIVVYLSGGGSTADVTGCTDLQGNSYTIAVQALTDNTAGIGAIAYASNIAGGSANKVTCSASTNKTFFSIWADEWSGIKSTSPVDVTGSIAPSGSVTAASSTITTTLANEVIIASAGRSGSTGTVAVGSGYTSNDAAGNGLAVFQTEWRPTTTAGVYTYNTTWATGAHVVLLAVAFKPAASQPGSWGPTNGSSVDLTNFRNMSLSGTSSAGAFGDINNCSAKGTAASPSLVACGAATAGAFSCDPAATGATCVISTTAVTANSDISVNGAASAGTRLAVTCNTTADAPTAPRIASISAGTSFTINLGTVTTNPACYFFQIRN